MYELRFCHQNTNFVFVNVTASAAQSFHVQIDPVRQEGQLDHFERGDRFHFKHLHLRARADSKQRGSVTVTWLRGSLAIPLGATPQSTPLCQSVAARRAYAISDNVPGSCSEATLHQATSNEKRELPLAAAT